ncbi:hypothetical protein [Methanoplanus endosymbiosus]|uniref:Uncharacterized protein n=1 Tax=Methanoplanus endosymbiosus TaxID=33865 RepID=A0A9E7PNC5_9EURY|nr:hypothetical protein [Methanoplanus endosymbiosus]UUX93040.1 hypothetical protein L6E24_02665 [Methanoplanus endosymbiosus]
MGKKLLIIPIIHSEEELGSLKDRISGIKEEKLGSEVHKKQIEEVHKLWRDIAGTISEIMQIIKPEKIQIFQDGMPAGGETGEKIVRECAANRSINYVILAEMINSGAEIEQTESPQYLKEEYDIIREIFSAKSPEEQNKLSLKYREKLHGLGINRDRFIAERINSSLKEGYTGILFIGATHNITPGLSDEINYYIYNYDRRAAIHWINDGVDNQNNL